MTLSCDLFWSSYALWQSTWQFAHIKWPIMVDDQVYCPNPHEVSTATRLKESLELSWKKKDPGFTWIYYLKSRKKNPRKILTIRQVEGIIGKGMWCTVPSMICLDYLNGCKPFRMNLTFAQISPLLYSLMFCPNCVIFSNIKCTYIYSSTPDALLY